MIGNGLRPNLGGFSNGVLSVEFGRVSIACPTCQVWGGEAGSRSPAASTPGSGAARGVGAEGWEYMKMLRMMIMRDLTVQTTLRLRVVWSQ